MAINSNLLDDIESYWQTNNTPQIGEILFTIYTKKIFEDPTVDISPESVSSADVTDDDMVADFQALKEFEIQYQVDIPTEPLEGGQFSNDSVLGSPYVINIIAVSSPAYERGVVYNDETRRQYIRDIVDALEENMNSQVIVSLIQSKPLFKTYPNLKINNFKYKISANQLNLFCLIQLQQVRETTAEYGTSNINTVANPQNSDTVQNGVVAAEDPDNSVLQGLKL